MPSNLTAGQSGLYLANTTAGTNSGWKQNNNVWASSGLTPNARYVFSGKSHNGGAVETAAAVAAKWTLVGAPSVGNNVTCNRAVSTWYPAGTAFTFTNPAGFGAGTHGGSAWRVTAFRYVWDANAAYSFGGSEPQWNAGSLVRSPAVSGSYYLHLQSRNGEGVAAATTLNYGPFRIDAVGPTGSVVVNGGAAYTSLTAATLSLSASDSGGSGIATMRLSNDGVWDTETWAAFATSRPWTLASSSGLKTVYAQYRDAAGNISVGTISDTILLDMAKPQSRVTLPTGSTTTLVLLLRWTHSDSGAAASGVRSVHVYWKKDFGDYSLLGTYPAATMSATFDTATHGGNGTYRFYCAATDNAGNVEAAPSVADVVIHVGPPSGVRNWWPLLR
jgi:hypothetical protein